MATDDSRKRPDGERAGINWLLIGVAVVTIAAVVVAAVIPPHSVGVALHSGLIFRIEAGLITWLVGYVAVAALWLASQRRLLKRIPLPGLGNAEAPEDALRQDIADLTNEVAKASAEMEEFRETTRNALAELGERVARLEGRSEAS